MTGQHARGAADGPIALAPEDEAFLRAFEDGSLEKGAFRHRDHVRLAWLCLRLDTPERALARVAHGVRAFAARHGVPQLYHETLTRVWLRLVAGAMRGRADASFDTFAAARPWLFDTSLPGRFYRPATLESAAARAGWVEPDLAPLPTHPAGMAEFQLPA